MKTKKNVIWGAGIFGARYMALSDEENFEFFIDSDLRKRGIFCNKSVVHPDEIDNWDELYLHLPEKYYVDILNYLDAHAIHDYEYTLYKDVKEIGYTQAKENLDLALNKIKILRKKPEILYLGLSWQVDYAHYVINHLSRYFGTNIIATDFMRQENGEVFEALSAPLVLDYVTVKSYEAPHEHINEVIQEKLYLTNASENIFHALDNENTQIDYDDCKCMVYLMYKYLKELIDTLSPKYVICHGTVSTQNEILWHLCKEKKIQVISMHPGVLPGTLTFDIGGDVGESLPALFASKFSSLPLTTNEINCAQGVWNYLMKSKLNRKRQPNLEWHSQVKNKLIPNRPIIFFAAQNDPGSRMIPYTHHTRKFFSPIFKSSLEAGGYLASICEKNEWNLIYKPHPSYIERGLQLKLPDNVIYLEQGNINDLVDYADVTVTIVSSTNYVALTRKKPVVMLGYNQIKGKGCTYDAYDLEEIEDKINTALECGFSKEQREKFLLHIAHCLKYYLYDDGTQREISYGRPLPKTIKDFYFLADKLDLDCVNSIMFCPDKVENKPANL